MYFSAFHQVSDEYRWSDSYSVYPHWNTFVNYVIYFLRVKRRWNRNLWLFPLMLYYYGCVTIHLWRIWLVFRIGFVTLATQILLFFYATSSVLILSATFKFWTALSENIRYDMGMFVSHFEGLYFLL